MQFDNEKKLSSLAVTVLDFAKKSYNQSCPGCQFLRGITVFEDISETSQEIQQHAQARSSSCGGNYELGGRLHNSPIKQDAKHPALLPKDHNASELVMHCYHLISSHSGLEHTLSRLRRQCGREVNAPDLKSVDPGLKSWSDHQLMLFLVAPSSTSRLCL